MLAANYDFIPGIQTAQFDLSFHVNLETLKQFFDRKNMDTKIKNDLLTARSNETHIHVTRKGNVDIHSFRRIRPSYLCKRIAEFRT